MKNITTEETYYLKFFEAIEDNDFSLVKKISHLDISKFFIKKGANINIKNNVLYTPLHLGFSSKSFNIIKTLINNGAVLNIKDSNNNSYLHLAVNKGQLNIIKILNNTFIYF